MDGNSRFHAPKRLAATVAILTIGFGLVIPPQSDGAGVWTNEPAGAAVVLDCPFNSVSGCGVLDAYSSSRIASDSSAPISATNVVQSTIYAGNSSGGMQLNYVTPQVNRQMYVGLMWRTNSAFFGRQVANKLFFVRGPASNGFFGLMGGPGGGNAQGSPFFLFFGPNASNVDNSHTCGGGGFTCFPNVSSGQTSPAGTWFKLEAYLKASTTNTSQDGIVRWWVNGVLAGNYTNMNISSAGLNEWVWSETWDGTVNPVPTVDWSHFIDHLHISIPGGGGSVDQPPGPPASPTLRSVTTP
ncbi:MAG: hypothetical protein OJF47_000155 [Nitrospira sp.]|jgi:hypothetical protein|nr:MAG: hypothetical protein OJF47_000155 [Nitrospira sp.]